MAAKKLPRTAAKKRSRPSSSSTAAGAVALLVATRKGAFVVRGDAERQKWTTSEPLFLGHIVYHVVQDPRAPEVLLMAARTGHLGHTIFRSTDGGGSWAECKRPPAFKKSKGGEKGLTVDHVFWLTPSNASEPGVWYAGTSPYGLFRSEDGGVTWDGVAGFNEAKERAVWCAGDGTPDGVKLHSVLVDPRDAAHLYLGMSSGGVMETLDRGRTWKVLIDGMEVVRGFDVTTQASHDPHCVRLSPADPDRLWQQNHCGIYLLDRPATRWTRVGVNMPAAVGDIGFPMVAHPRDRDACFVFPMDGTDVWPRTSPGGKPAVYTTTNGGSSWKRLDRGMPRGNAFFTVKRQAMTADDRDPLGIYFGTTNGEVWGSVDEGRNWRELARHLPHVYAVEVAYLGASSAKRRARR